VVDDSFLLCFNAHKASVEFLTPDGDYATQWTADLDTSAATGAVDLVVKAGESVTLPGRSVLVFRKTA
jgi:glycogen operon protein